MDFEDLLDLIESCDENEKDLIRDIVGYPNNWNEISENAINVENLYDLEVLKLLKVASKKYNLEQLMEKLDVKNSEY
jgi:hypothetical protein